MHDSVEVIQEDGSGLVRDVYRLVIGERLVVLLEKHTIESRPSTRHRWRVQKQWSRLDRRDNTMERPDVPYTVVNQALQQFRDQITFSERDNWR